MTIMLMHDKHAVYDNHQSTVISMEIKVLEEKNNPLLQRREIQFNVSHNLGTPSREEIKGKLAAYLNSKPELVIIERMKSDFGRRETKGYAKIYESVDRLKNVETEHIIQRNEKKPAPKEEEKKA